MNAIFSLMLCLAMLFGGTDLPDAPQIAATASFNNISLTVGDESVTFAPEIRITTALGAQELAGRFETELNGNTLLPITGVLTPEGVDYALTDAPHYISVSGAAIDGLIQQAGLADEDMALVERLPAAAAAFERVLRRAGEDRLIEYDEARITAEYLAEQHGVRPSEVEVEIDGEARKALRYEIDTTKRRVYDGYDYMLTCGEERIEQAYADMLELFGALDGVQYASFAEAAQTLLYVDDRAVESYTLASGEGWHYMESTGRNFDGDGNEFHRAEMTELLREGSADIGLCFRTNDAPGEYVFDVKGRLRGDASSPEAVEVEFSMNASDGQADDAARSSAVRGSLNADAAGWTLEVEWGDDMSEPNHSASVEVAKEQQSDGGAIYAWRITLPEQRAELCFDVSISAQPYVSFFDGKQAREHDLSDTSAANTQLGIDALALAADAAALAADESVQRFGAMLGDLLLNLLPIVDLGPVSGYNEYSVANTYASIEEARAHYDGVIPDIAMPEEFRLVEVCLISGVSGDVELHYSCGEEEAYIWFSGSEQVQPSGEAYYRVAGDGSLRRMRDTIVRIRNYDSGAVSASISSRDFNCTLAFYNIDDMERIQAIIAGLCP